MKISVIIPVFNEEKVVGNCLESLAKQTIASDTEIIVIDDGSTDASASAISNFKFKISNLVLLQQNHQGPGAARNLGATKAKGDILVFADADMEFEPDFIAKLTAPIKNGTIGTFSKEEYLLNKDNVWARCWNLNLRGDAERMVDKNYPETAPVFRAILRKKFEEAGGFDATVGYTDDWTISRKLGVPSMAAPGAKFYHRNPDNLGEVWRQARWFGKNEFLTRNLTRKTFNLARSSLPVAKVKGLAGAIKYREPAFFIFKIVYDTAVWTSVFLSFFGEHKAK